VYIDITLRFSNREKASVAAYKLRTMGWKLQPDLTSRATEVSLSIGASVLEKLSTDIKALASAIETDVDRSESIAPVSPLSPRAADHF